MLEGIRFENRLYTPAEIEKLIQIAQAGQVFIGIRRTAPGRPIMAPSLPAYYIPRSEELRRLKAALGLNGEPVSPEPLALTAMHGMGGVGKTVLATALAHDPNVQATFPDGILWASLGPEASERSDADPWLLGWGAVLGFDLRDCPSVETRSQALAASLAQRCCLLVVDDVWAATPARLLLDARGQACRVVITTRLAHVAEALGAPQLRVDVLTAGEALALLEKRLGQTLIDNERAQAEELAQRMGYLPLALVLAAAQMNLGVTWEELLTAFRTMQGPLEALDLDEAKTREESLRLSFDLSYEHLSREDQKHYRLLGVLAPKAPFTAGDAMVVWGEGDESAAIGTLRRLAARALIEFVETALPGRPKEAADSKGPALFRQHLLLRDDALRRMTPEEQKETVACHVSHYLALAQGARTTQDYLPVDTALAQVRAVLRRAQRGYAGDGGLVAAEGDAARKLLIFAMSTLTQYWSLRCMYHEWIEWNQEVLKCNVTLGNRQGQAASFGQLGAAYAALNEPKKAIEYYRQAQALNVELGDRRGQAAALGGLGAAYAALGESRQAAGYYEQALALSEELGDRKGQAAAYGQLGAAYAALGESRQAAGYYEQALALSEELGDRKGQAAAYGQLGAAYAALNEPKKAIEYYRQAQALNVELGDRRGQAAALGGLGAAYAALGESRQAAGYYEQALALSEELGDRKGQAAAYGQLGAAYAALNEPRKAIEYYRQAQALNVELGDRRGQAAALGGLGAAYAALNEPKKAIEYYEQAQALNVELGDRRGQAASFGQLGAAYAALNEPKKAIEYHQQSLALSEELGDRRGQAAALGGLGAAYAALNEPKKAIEYHQQSLALSEELGDRRGQAAALGGLGAAYAALNEPKKAIEYYQQALALDIELGDEKGQAQALGALGAAHGRSGDWAHAIEHYERAAAIQKRIEDWFHLAKTLGGLTRAYRQVGNIKRAIEVTRYNVSISRGWQLELAKQQLHELLASQDEPRQDSS